MNDNRVVQDRHYTMHDPTFEWDDVKARQNLRKHRVGFGEAAKVFSDPNCLLKLDQYVDGEERWRAIGVVGVSTLLLVIHTRPGEDGIDIIRIISARRAMHSERRRYGHG